MFIPATAVAMLDIIIPAEHLYLINTPKEARIASYLVSTLKEHCSIYKNTATKCFYIGSKSYKPTPEFEGKIQPAANLEFYTEFRNF